jgi:hypothetical protein
VRTPPYALVTLALFVFVCERRQGTRVVCDVPACMLTWFRSSWYNRAQVLILHGPLFDELQKEKDRGHLPLDGDDRSPYGGGRW